MVQPTPLLSRLITLKRTDTCQACGRNLAVGETAWWVKRTRAVTCTTCWSAVGASDSLHPPPTLPPGAGLDASDDGPPALQVGIPGASALARYERLHAKREEKVRARWGRVAGMALALSTDPQSTRAWQRGSSGESKLGKAIASLGRDDIIVLHDRRVPRTRGNIDHVVICPSGIYVVDSKHYEGRIEVRNVGGFLSGKDLRLFVGRHDCTHLANDMDWQVAAVKKALQGAELPIHSVLCFIDADWPLFSTLETFRGVRIESERTLKRRISQRGPLGTEAIRTTAMLLAQKLPAYRSRAE